jgi:hypothetical protein
MIKMSETKVNNNSICSNTNAIIIAVTIVVIAITLMFFRDRQQKRNLQLQHLDTQMKAWDEFGVPRQNRQLNTTTAQGGEVIL